MPPSVFLNYRSADTAALAVLVERGLTEALGPGAVFRDHSAIPPGKDFRKDLWRRLYGCDVLVALIGAHWWDPVTPGGEAPVMDPDDFVRREIEAALEWEIEVVPVLTERVGSLEGRAFPESLESLPYRQHRTIRDRSPEADIRTLAQDLRPLTGERKAPDAGVRNSGIITYGNNNVSVQSGWASRD